MAKTYIKVQRKNGSGKIIQIKSEFAFNPQYMEENELIIVPVPNIDGLTEKLSEDRKELSREDQIKQKEEELKAKKEAAGIVDSDRVEIPEVKPKSNKK